MKTHAETLPAPPLARVWAWTAHAWERLPLREPWRVLVPLLVVEWAAIGALATSVHHNGWLYYQGGDQIWYWSTSWLLGHGLVAKALVSLGWPLLLAPFAPIVGAGYVAGLPAAILIQVLLLTPLALYFVYDLAARIGGRVVGYVAALLWTVGPYLAIPLFVQRYHEKYVDEFLPHPLGLTAMADFPGTVAVVVAAALAVRAFELRDVRVAILAGLVGGYAGLIKPSNLLFLPAPVVALAIGRRWRELAAGALAVVPALVALSIWKYKGYGYLPAFQSLPQHEVTRVALGTDTITSPYHKYVNIDWSHLQNNFDGIGQVFWSLRVLQFLPFAGALAVARRAPVLAVFVSVWFWVFLILKGSNVESSVDSGSFFRFLLPAVPALVVMVAALPLLIPRYGPLLSRRFPAPRPRAVSSWLLVGATLLLGLLPVAVAAAVSPLVGFDRAVNVNGLVVPIDRSLDLTATVRGGTVSLRWQPVSQGQTKLYYRVLRVRGGLDVTCPARNGAASQCAVLIKRQWATRATRFVDRPGPGEWSYRVGVGANWLDDPHLGDIFLISPRVGVTVGRP